MELAGKVAVITGAGQGIGLGIARVLVREGARVVLTDIDQDRVAEAALEFGDSAFGVQQNVADPASSDEVIARTNERFGALDIFVNNAGVAQQKPFSDTSESDWDLILDVNAKGTWFASAAAGAFFRAQGAGKIVNIASFCGKQAIAEYGPYNASKFAVVGMTQTLALELGPHNVNVNAVAPGVVKTPLWDSLDPSQWEMQEQRIPLRRGQMPEDIGEAVSFLASERARNITGTTLGVTGGLSNW